MNSQVDREAIGAATAVFQSAPLSVALCSGKLSTAVGRAAGGVQNILEMQDTRIACGTQSRQIWIGGGGWTQGQV